MRKLGQSAFAICLVTVMAAGLVSVSWAQGTGQKSPAAAGRERRSSAAVRVYVMNGLFGEVLTRAMSQIGERLRRRGAVVQVGSWAEESAFVADACAHREERIVFIGHSMGAVAAAGAVRQARACGVRHVRMVGIDPPAMGSVIPVGTHSTNFVGTLDAAIPGAHNVRVSGFGHIAIVNDPAMQRRVVAAALR